MIDSVLVAALAWVAGGLLPAAPFAVSAAVLVTVGLLRVRIGPARSLFALLLVCLSAWRTSSALRSFEQERERTWRDFGSPSRCSGTVRVAGTPSRARDGYVFAAEAGRLECDGNVEVHPGTRMRLYGSSDELSRGDTCFVIGTIGVVEVFRNEDAGQQRFGAARQGAILSGGLIDLRVVERGKGIGAWIDRARSFARRRIEATYPPAAAPMARALVLGENDLDPADAEAFRISGLSHILAVSGTHVVIAVLGAVRVLQALLVRVESWTSRIDVGRLSAAAGVPLVWAYAEFAGSGGSVRRAAWMATAALLARALERNPSGVRAFALSLLAGSLGDPLAAFDASFGLSAGATAGLMVLSRPLERWIGRLPAPFRWVREPVACTLGATLACTPWLMMLSPTLSPIGIVANVIAVPIGETVSLPACLAHLALFPLPAAERGTAWLGSMSLLAVRTVARAGASLSWANLPLPQPTSWQLASAATAAAAIACRPRRERVLLAAAGFAAWMIAEAAAVRAGTPHGKLRITFLDVGQGDSMLLDFPNGASMLIDGGGAVGSPVDPGRTVIGPVMRARRRKGVDVAVLTHPHPDHLIGLASALPEMRVGQFWDNGQGEEEEVGPIWRGLVRTMKDRGVPIFRPSALCKAPARFGAAEVRVIGPCPEIVSGGPANDNSVVLRVSLGERAALLVGDAEHEEETRLLAAARSLLHADLLKVGHHGSRTSSSPEFLDAVNPSAAVASCGVRNRFGHPHPNTVAAFQSRGIPLLRTDELGGLVWETDGDRVRLRSAVAGELTRVLHSQADGGHSTEGRHLALE